MQVVCPHCRQMIELDSELMEQKVKCPLCEGHFIVEKPPDTVSKSRRMKSTPHKKPFSTILSKKRGFSYQKLWFTLVIIFSVILLSCGIGIIIVLGHHQYDRFLEYARHQLTRETFSQEVDRQIALQLLGEYHPIAYNEAASGRPNPHREWHFFVSKDQYWERLRNHIYNELSNFRSNPLPLAPQHLSGVWEGIIPGKNQLLVLELKPDGKFFRTFYPFPKNEDSPLNKDQGVWSLTNNIIHWGETRPIDTILYLNNSYLIIKTSKGNIIRFRKIETGRASSS